MTNGAVESMLSPDQSIAARILSLARQQPDTVAIEFVDGERWTRQQLISEAWQAVAQLAKHAVCPGDVVALMVDDPVDFCRFWLGCLFSGVTMVAINTGLRGNPLRHQLCVSNAQLVIASEAHLPTLESLTSAPVVLSVETLKRASTAIAIDSHTRQLYPSAPQDTHCIMFTSGTSGPSKGVLMPHAHCMLFAIGTIENFYLGEEDTFYICLPLFHANGLFMQLLACMVCGARAVVRERFSATRWLADIRHYQATHTNMLGAVAAFIVAQPVTADDQDHKLRVIGAAPLPATAEKSFRERFGVPGVVPLYGMTEVNIPLYGRLDESAPGTCGRVYQRYYEVEIHHPATDKPVPAGSTGEIVVRPKHPFGFMSGYVNMPEKTVEAWRNFWFHTGDAGYIDEQGRFVFVDRIKDCIRRRGENISSYEVEQAFLALPGIAEAAAYAIAIDEEGMEDEVMVCVQPAPGSRIDLLQCLEKARPDLPKFAVPRYLRVAGELPKTPTGKIRKVELRREGVTEDTIDVVPRN